MLSQAACIGFAFALAANPVFAQSTSDYLCQESGLYDMPNEMLTDTETHRLMPEAMLVVSLASIAIPYAHVCGIDTESYELELFASISRLSCSAKSGLGTLANLTFARQGEPFRRARVSYNTASLFEEERRQICARLENIDFSAADRTSMESIRPFTGVFSKVSTDMWGLYSRALESEKVD